jgi:hypothetical protein
MIRTRVSPSWLLTLVTSTSLHVFRYERRCELQLILRTTGSGDCIHSETGVCGGPPFHGRMGVRSACQLPNELIALSRKHETFNIVEVLTFGSDARTCDHQPAFTIFNLEALHACQQPGCGTVSDHS